MPTSLLERQLQMRVQTPGASRLVELTEPTLLKIPSQSIASWVGAPISTEEWMQNILKTAKFGTPFGHDAFQMFNHWGNIRSSPWQPLDPQEVPDGSIVLAQHAPSNGPYSYYLLRIRTDEVTAMADLGGSIDILRLKFGLRATAGNPATYHRSRPQNGAVDIRSPIVPDEERRLLNALGPVEEQEQFGGLRAIVPSETADIVCGFLDALGLKCVERN